MENITFVLDIGSGATKLLAGYVIEGQPIVLEALKVAIPQQITQGRIAKIDSSVNAVKTLIIQMEKSLDVKIAAVTLVVPEHDLQVFAGRKTTNIISQQGIIAPMDIKNLNNLFKKESAGATMAQAGIVPEQFILDDENVYDQPPLGLTSNNISLDANLHFIRRDIFQDYLDVCAKVGLKIKKTVVAAHGISEVTAALLETPEEYLLIDLGGKTTSVSFIAANRLYAAVTFELGGYDLSEAIASGLGLSFEDALRLQEHYGYDERENTYDGIIFRSSGETGPKTIRQSELNQVITPFFKTWLEQLASVPSELQRHVQAAIDFASLPWMFTGGARKLQGFRALYGSMRGHEPYIWPHLDVIGARDPQFAAGLGALFVTDKYAALTDEVLIPVTNVQRVKGTSKKAQYNAYDDEL